MTPIGSDGTWAADITTGGIDEQATKITAFLVPSSFSEPCILGAGCIPEAFEQQAIAKASVVRQNPGPHFVERIHPPWLWHFATI